MRQDLRDHWLVCLVRFR